jgi:hypothetical protein
MTRTDLEFDDQHHIQITAYLVDGPNDWLRPRDEPGKRVIAGVKLPADKWKYREIVEAHLDLAKAQILKHLEQGGVFQ